MIIIVLCVSVDRYVFEIIGVGRNAFDDHTIYKLIYLHVLTLVFFVLDYCLLCNYSKCKHLPTNSCRLSDLDLNKIEKKLTARRQLLANTS